MIYSLCTGEKGGLDAAQQETACQQGAKAIDRTCRGTDNTPQGSHHAEVDGRPFDLPKDHVAGNLSLE